MAAGDPEAGWAALLEGGHVALIRHGNAPPGYGGDPPEFRIDDCATQRNLDEQGRQEARALGETFRHHGVRVDRIRSSPWCRCLDTARLMAVGPVETSWALVPDTAPGVSVRLQELKQIVAFAGERIPTSRRCSRDTERDVTITSFAKARLEEVRASGLDVPFGWLVPEATEAVIAEAGALGVAQLGPKAGTVTATLVSRLHRAGFLVRAWGVGTE
jgi:hypothetical protein